MDTCIPFLNCLTWVSTMDHNTSSPFKNVDLHFSEILDNMEDGVVIYDAEGNYVYVNTVMIKWRNLSREEFLKRNVHDFIPIIDICVFDLVCQQKQKVSRLQYYRDFQDPSKPKRLRLVTGIPFFNADGSIRWVFTVLVDIQRFENEYGRLAAQKQLISDSRLDNLAPEISEQIIAVSPITRQLLSLAQNIAGLDSTILLSGESGTGKEVFASYIHNHSSRSSRKMITVNCASIPENLIEAELFGYEKGSFTGANREGKTGLVEAADKSTLFLDEINSLPLPIQGKLLRMIEEKSIQRIGSVKTKKVDFRLITATNRDLENMVRKGEFREDLYYRLNVIPMIIPPIRSRKEDIIPLCEYFLDQFGQKYGLRKTFSKEVHKQILSYDWPGNVREIRNFVERMVVMTPHTTSIINNIPEGALSGMIEVSDDNSRNLDYSNTYPEFASAPSNGRLSREAILEALDMYHGHRQKTAEYLGISRRYLQYKIHEYRISDRCKY